MYWQVEECRSEPLRDPQVALSPIPQNGERRLVLWTIVCSDCLGEALKLNHNSPLFDAVLIRATPLEFSYFFMGVDTVRAPSAQPSTHGIGGWPSRKGAYACDRLPFGT
jgi:hypothetical protein